MRRPILNPTTALISGAVVVACNLLAPARSWARPDGADWSLAATAEGCAACHLGTEAPVDSDALLIEGLPAAFAAGKSYRLTIVLADPALRNAGFLLTILGDDGTGAGQLAAIDSRTEAAGGQARSTWDGSFTARPGLARWTLDWTAPAAGSGELRFDLWGNAGNDDLSPLGDRLFHREFTLGPLATSP